MARRDQVRAAEHADSGARRDARGRLDVVATPIGNLADLTPRARDALAAADLVAAEDTRHTGALLRHLGIQTQLRSLHDYNETARVDELIAELRAGRIVALVSDAGTPLLSDPGYALVRAAAEAGITVRAVPGASALTAALSIAGLPTDRFVFEGFLPARPAARRARLAELAGETRTLVFFEAPHRIGAMLADLAALLGVERRAVIARELTKLHESAHRGRVDELMQALREDPNIGRGEITVVVQGAGEAAAEEAGADPGRPDDVGAPETGADEARAGGAEGRAGAAAAPSGVLLARALRLLLAELPPARAAAIAAQLAGVPRRQAYALAQRLRASGEVEPPP